MYCGTPSQFSDTGVSRTTTSSGTMKIRESVSVLGKFTLKTPRRNFSNQTRSLECRCFECQDSRATPCPLLNYCLEYQVLRHAKFFPVVTELWFQSLWQLNASLSGAPGNT